MARLRNRTSRRKVLTYANVISTLCLFLLLGGTAYAVTSLPANSVGPKQLRSQAVTLPKIASSAQNALKGDRGATGARGPIGKQGITGDKGEPGASGSGLTPVDWTDAFSTAADPSIETLVDQDGLVLSVQCLQVNIVDTAGQPYENMVAITATSSGSEDGTIIVVQSHNDGTYATQETVPAGQTSSQFKITSMSQASLYWRTPTQRVAVQLTTNYLPQTPTAAGGSDWPCSVFGYAYDGT